MISLTSPVETRAHRWPAGAKLAGLCVSTVILFAVNGLPFHAMAFSLVLLVYSLPGKQFFTTGLGRLTGFWPFVLLIALWHLVIGMPVEGAVVILRLLTAIALANLVTMTTRLSAMIEVVKWLATPFRKLGLNTRALELGIALVVRFTPRLTQNGSLLLQAWSARSARKPGWRIVLPFTVLAIDDAEQVAEAIRARGGI